MNFCLKATFEKMLEDKKTSEDVKEEIRRLLPLVIILHFEFWSFV